MKRFDDDKLGAALRELRPTPSPEFAAELDQRAAAGFPRRQSRASSPLARLRACKPRQLLLPVGGVALTALAVATVLVIAGESSGGHTVQRRMTGLLQSGSAEFNGPLKAGGARSGEETGKAPVPPGHRPGNGAESGGAGGAAGAEEAMTGPAEVESNPEVKSSSGGINMYKADKPLPPVTIVGGKPAETSESYSAARAGRQDRKVERSAEIVIGTEPGEVGAASSKVFQAVHAYDGIVLNSSTRDGSGTSAEASFELLIPSAKLGDAMAAFSRIGEVHSRHEATEDITAPTVGVEEKLTDSRARIDSLLSQLRDAGEEGERELVEAELRSERRHSAHLEAQLDQLGKRASLSRVSVEVESGKGALSPAGPDDGKWGVGDALHSAGRVLAVAAGIAIVGAAVLAPIALLLLLAWLASRAWSRRARERALS